MKTKVVLFLLFTAFVTSAIGQTRQEKSVTVFGANVRYVEAGDAAKPTVILLHGLGGTTDTSWPLTIPALSATHRVIGLDLLGFGKSDKPQINYRIDFYVDFLDRFMTEIKLDRATLIGSSMGGWIAVNFAAKYPLRTQKLVLVASGGYAPPPNFDYGTLALNMNPSTRDGVRAGMKALFYNSAPLMSDAVVDNILTSRITAGDGYAIQMLIRNAQFANEYFDERVKTLKQPILVIWGKQDGIAPAALADRLHKDIAGSELAIFDQAAHFPQIEKAVEFNKRVAEFLAK